MAKKESAESSEIPWPYAVNRTYFLSVYNQIVALGVPISLTSIMDKKRWH